MLHNKFHGNRPAASKEDFLRVFTIYWRGGHLGHVSSFMSSDLYFLVYESFHKNLVQIGTVVCEKIRFEFLYVHDLGPRSNIFSVTTWSIKAKFYVEPPCGWENETLFWFKSGICLLISPVPAHCFSVTFNTQIPSYIRLDVCSYLLSITGCNSF